MRELDKYGNPIDAKILQRFFKTGKGQYGEGDIFIGVKMPVIRKIAKQYKVTSLQEIERLLDSPIHEYRMAALVILMEQFKKAKIELKKNIYNLYLRRMDRINNWDLVDVSCRDIVGGYLLDKPRDDLYKMSRSNNLWERRIAIVATWRFIREGQYKDTIDISQKLLKDRHDLIQKAVGWMLREVGKKDLSVLIGFLDESYKVMPRTMLRYSIERLSTFQRNYYLGRTA